MHEDQYYVYTGTLFVIYFNNPGNLQITKKITPNESENVIYFLFLFDDKL